MNLTKVGRAELISIIGAALLAVGLFLDWYKATGTTSQIAGMSGPLEITGWDVHTTIRWLLLAAVVSPIVLTYIIIRDHSLSWPRGELTAVIGIIAFGLVLYNGLIDKPGEPRGLISIQFGYFIALLGTILMLGGGALRASESERRRKPPGVL